ncbi:sensor domain-containing diguanylate cyclase [Mycobacterium sp. CVI_P3]|uniref:Sensor domain-containing diguanylate cyclase n=1 Tax=Mycobacterium pinniadriaticum TaxID=2994102 RepID=A0ABT3SMS2_9MYCO|nr:sensor domain-containing diguanylate cyclase [Mycobacterium pinniadriaticum]MCX2934397.1 sensor domain-containing diguanylate cyclase [Mycobacterium pinniadriaticum]MCX2940820.1 sensor domain-containing diguanylate cyclase [Mycobacterium pinniadriaticum]
MSTLLMLSGRAALGVVLAIAAVDWLGWATGTERLTRVWPSWPQMVPWTALLLAALAVAILVLSGEPSPARVRVGCGLAVVAGLAAVAFLTEYAAGLRLGLDQWWFPGEVRAMQKTWPGRPSPQTAATVLLLAIAVGLTRLDQRWARAVRVVSLVAGVALPAVMAAAYLFQALSVIAVTPSTGMAISTALCLLLLGAASFAARLDHNPAAWLLARSDAWTLVRMVGVLAGLPIVIGLSRLALLMLGVPSDAAWALSISVGTVTTGVAMFYLSQREQRLLIDKELLSRERADAEARYRILAENAVDTVIRLHGTEVEWISPSVQAAFGDPPSLWVGSDFTGRVHPDDMHVVAASAQRIAAGKPSVGRFRVRTAGGGYHWVDCRSKPYFDGDGQADGLIAALRVVDDQVDAERRLEHLARFDPLTGLVNRAEVMRRLEAALDGQPEPGSYIGLLFCDIDEFKKINDTQGHAVGDLVLATMAMRVHECVRPGDTVGRTGGDELLILLPGIGGIDEATAIAEAIRSRAAEPIPHGDRTICATLSIGVTLASPGEPVTSMTTRADSAMYRAKHAGRNAVVCLAP